MRKYKVKSIIDIDNPEPEIIEADNIQAVDLGVEFQVKDDTQDYGFRTIAVRMNCNVTEVSE